MVDRMEGEAAKPNDSAAVSAHRPVLVERGGRFFFHIESLGLIGAGDDVPSAYADLKRRYGELLRTAREADLVDALPVSGAAGKSFKTGGTSGAVMVRSDLKGFVLRVAIVAAALLIVLLPVVWSVGGAVERTAAKLQVKGGRNFWIGVENGLHKAAEPGNEMSPEEQARVLADIRVLVARIKPFADELRPLIEGASPNPSGVPSGVPAAAPGHR